MVQVIAFPPVGVVGTMWTPEAPVQRSQGMISGQRYVSAFGRSRIIASLGVSALSLNRSGAGYSEMLKHYLDGGVNLVRLNSYPINWHLDYLPDSAGYQARRGGLLLNWTSNDNPLDWLNRGGPLFWFNGAVLSGEANGSTITVTGLPPNKLIVRPADVIKAYGTIDSIDFVEALTVTESFSDADGVAVIELYTPIAAGSYARVNIGVSQSRVFEVTNMPQQAQSIGQNWVYEWGFSEVFADQTDGFEEVNPW